MKNLKHNIIKNDIESFFPIGQKISIKRSYTDDTLSYPSYVKDVCEDYVFVDLISNAGTLIPIREDAEVEVILTNSQGAWQGVSTVWEVVKNDLGGIWLTFPEDLKLIQERQFLRLETVLPVTFFATNLFYQIELVKGYTKNISGSGVAVITDKPLNKFRKLSIDLSFGDIKIISDVKFVHTRKDHATNQPISGLHFIDLEYAWMQRIHQQIVELQMEQHKKGLI